MTEGEDFFGCAIWNAANVIPAHVSVLTLLFALSYDHDVARYGVQSGIISIAHHPNTERCVWVS